MILVTGSAGYIGSHLIKKLHLNNVKFLGIDNLSYSKKENIYYKQKFIKRAKIMHIYIILCCGENVLIS